MLIPLRKLFLSGYRQFRKLNRVEIEQKIYLYVPNRSASVAYEGGGEPPGPPMRAISEGGGLHWYYNLTLHYPSKLCLIKYCINHPCFPFWKRKFLFVVSLQKWLAHFFFSETNGEMKVSNVHQTCHSINWNYMYSI